MPIDHEVLNDGEMLISTVTGVLTGDDLADHMFWQINQLGETLNKDYQHVFDTTGAENVDMDEDDMKRISQIILTYGQERGKTVTALVAVHPEIRKLSYYYKSLAEITDTIIEVFTGRPEANNWLAGLK